MDGNAVSLAAIGFAASMGAGVIWVVKYLANTLSRDIKEHTIAATQLTAAAEEQTASSKEVLTFMKNLNGKLANATIQTINEQHIQTQNVTEAKTEVVADRRKQ